jgi:hypothetical protein
MPEETFCTCCGIGIHWQPTIVDGKLFCCLGCAEGGPCICDYDNLPKSGKPNELVIRPGPGYPMHDALGSHRHK